MVACPELLRRGADPLQKQKAAHVVDDVGEPNPHGSLGDAHRPDEQSCL